MYVCTYSRHIHQSIDQAGKAVNPVRGRLKREKGHFPVPVRARESGLARQVRPSRPASACLFSILRLNLVLTHGISPDVRGGVSLVLPPCAIGSGPSLSGQAITYRWRSLPRVRRHRASSPQGSSSNECYVCITTDQLLCASLFSYPLLLV